MTTFVTPVGRMVFGSPYERVLRTDSRTQQPVLINGEQVHDTTVAIAIPKKESDWRQSVWGKNIFDVASKAFEAKVLAIPSFSWKIIDGDSPTPNKSGNIPNQQQGYAGNWILIAKTNRLPPCADANGAPLMDQSIYPGCHIQILVECASNNSQTSPGVYVNLKACRFVSDGERIEKSGGVVNVATVDWGVVTPPVAPAAPNYAVLQPAPPAPPAPSAPPAPPAPPAKVMTALANGASYESFIAAGWNDDMLRQHGYLA